LSRAPVRCVERRFCPNIGMQGFTQSADIVAIVRA
jgi:hypothetical protein